MPVIGNTVRFRGSFRDWDGTYVNVSNIEFTIYDKEQNEVFNTVIGIENDSTGKYYYDYEIPTGYGYLVFEFKGDYQGNQLLDRMRVPRKWTSN